MVFWGSRLHGSELVILFDIIKEQQKQAQLVVISINESCIFSSGVRKAILGMTL